MGFQWKSWQLNQFTLAVQTSPRQRKGGDPEWPPCHVPPLLNLPNIFPFAWSSLSPSSLLLCLVLPLPPTHLYYNWSTLPTTTILFPFPQGCCVSHTTTRLPGFLQALLLLHSCAKTWNKKWAGKDFPITASPCRETFHLLNTYSMCQAAVRTLDQWGKMDCLVIQWWWPFNDDHSFNDEWMNESSFGFGLFAVSKNKEFLPWNLSYSATL